MLKAVAAIAALCFVVAGCTVVDGRFYDPAVAELAGAPGTIIRQQTLPPGPEGAAAYRILYRSTGLQGEPIAVSGVLLVPRGDIPEDGRRIVAWAHPTTGVATRCAPSLAPLQYYELAGLTQMLSDGYAVVATDYPGLGTPGVHPYLVGESEGRAVLDSVRAAHAVLGNEVDDRFALWGHSQGGHAAIWASLIAASYAPELTPVGVALAAPATELRTLIRDDAATDDGKNLTALSVWAWSRLFDAPIDNVVEPDKVDVVNAVAADCIDTISGLIERRTPVAELDEGFLKVPDITTVEPWGRLIAQNTPGVMPAGLPVFIAQGEADELVLPPVTRNYYARLCAAGRPATLLMMPGIDHGQAGRAAAPSAIAWITDRFNGTGNPNGCPR